MMHTEPSLRETSEHERVAPSRRSILLVDDDPEFRDIVGVALDELGLDVREARDGLEALTLAHDAEMEFAAVLLDERMPALRGSDAAGRLRSLGVAAPIIMVTAARNVESIAERAGTEHWLQKPFGVRELRQMLKSVGAL